jgi:hypothetical protein
MFNRYASTNIRFFGIEWSIEEAKIKLVINDGDFLASISN